MHLEPFTPKPAATLRLAPDHRINIWEGAVRSGKTVASLLAWAQHIANGPDGALLMVGKTTDTLMRNCLDPLRDLLGPEHVKPVTGLGIAWILGRKVHLVGAANEAAETRIRGLTLAGAYVDEVTILPQNFWQMLLSRMSIEGARVYATTNPASPRHWLLTDYLSNASTVIEQASTVNRYPTGTSLARYRFTIDDNPSLPAEYVESLKSMYTGLFYRRFISGEWVAAEGAVYPALDLTPDSPMVWTAYENTGHGFTHLTLGIDHGATNPTHAVLLGVQDGRVWVLSEKRIIGQYSIAQQAAILYDWIRAGAPTANGLTPLPVLPPEAPLPANVRVIIDPAAAAFRTQWNTDGHGWPWKANNSVLEGIQKTGALLTANRLLLNPDATPELVRELSGYMWDPRAAEQGKDAPIKQDDHGVDALRYAVMAVHQQLTGQ